jgi:hypothetical protein
VDGREELGFPQGRLLLAHVPDRSPLQLARKTILGRLKPLASGQATAGHINVHRAADFEALKGDARAWLERPEATGSVEDPVAYRGGPLRYTGKIDELSHMLSVFAGQAELLARSHGAILDRKRLVKRELLQRGAEARRLF